MSLGTDPTIRAAVEGDLPQVLALLETAGLPVEGVPELGELQVAVDRQTGVVACAGMEIHGSAGLLRSVAVQEERQGEGLGAALTKRMLERAAERRLARVYLLTETAPRFFARLGFTSISRDLVEGAVRASSEFAHLCPDSAEVMMLELPVT